MEPPVVPQTDFARGIAAPIVPPIVAAPRPIFARQLSDCPYRPLNLQILAPLTQNDPFHNRNRFREMPARYAKQHPIMLAALTHGRCSRLSAHATRPVL